MNEKTYIICDNQYLTRSGLIALLGSQIKNANIVLASDKTALEEGLKNNPKSVVIINFDSLDFDEIEEIQAYNSTFPDSRWLFIAHYVTEFFIEKLTQVLPNANLILKKNSVEDIWSSILATETGQRFFCSEALDIMLGKKPKRVEGDDNKVSALTPTEREIVQLLAQGKASKDIAVERNLSVYTVITHRKNIFRKMEVNTVHELTKLALKYGLVDLTEYYI